MMCSTATRLLAFSVPPVDTRSTMASRSAEPPAWKYGVAHPGFQFTVDPSVVPEPKPGKNGKTLYGNRVRQVFLPYDLPFAVDRFLARFAPRMGLLMETELWPNLVMRAAARGILHVRFPT